MTQRRKPKTAPAQKPLAEASGVNYVSVNYGAGSNLQTGLFRVPQTRQKGSPVGSGLFSDFGGGGGGGGGGGTYAGTGYQVAATTAFYPYSTDVFVSGQTPDSFLLAFSGNEMAMGSPTQDTAFLINHRISLNTPTIIGGQSTFSATWRMYIDAGVTGITVGRADPYPSELAVNANYAVSGVNQFTGVNSVFPLPFTPNLKVEKEWRLKDFDAAFAFGTSFGYGKATIGPSTFNGSTQPSIYRVGE